MVHAQFDLLMSFRQDNRSIDNWYNTVQAHIPLCEHPSETATVLTRDIFSFFMSDTEFIAKTVNEGNSPSTVPRVESMTWLKTKIKQSNCQTY